MLTDLQREQILAERGKAAEAASSHTPAATKKETKHIKEKTIFDVDEIEGLVIPDENH